MIKKTIKYHDYDGDTREDTFYFSLNQAQFAKIDRMFPGGLEEYTNKIIKDKNAGELFNIISVIVNEAYGERVGNGFVKVGPNGQKLSDFFVNTEAYDNLLTELISSEDALVHFMAGCLNKDAQDKALASYEKMKADMEKEAGPAVIKLPE